MSSNTAPGAGSWEPGAPLGDQVTGPAEVFESMLLEDGVLGAIETVLSGLQVAGTDPVTLQLEGMKLLAADVARRMTRPDPFAVAEHDDGWFVPSDLPQGQATEPGADVEAAGSDTCGAGLAPEAAAAAPASGSLDTTADDAASAGTSAAELPQAWRDADAAAARLARFEDVAVAAHQVMNQAGAVRAYAAERCARFDAAPDTSSWTATDCLSGAEPRPGDVVEHRPGHRGRFIGDLLAPSLRLGPQAADSVVDAAVWLTQRTPALLAAVARGEANLDTAAAIARELQDARPDTCELVEDAVLGRGVHQRSLSPARRSARVLVERFEATAARTTLRRTQAQQTGVWLDPHITPGLSSLTAVMPTGQAASVMDAVDQRARTAQHEPRPPLATVRRCCSGSTAPTRCTTWPWATWSSSPTSNSSSRRGAPRRRLRRLAPRRRPETSRRKETVHCPRARRRPQTRRRRGTARPTPQRSSRTLLPAQSPPRPPMRSPPRQAGRPSRPNRPCRS